MFTINANIGADERHVLNPTLIITNGHSITLQSSFFGRIIIDENLMLQMFQQYYYFIGVLDH